MLSPSLIFAGILDLVGIEFTILGFFRLAESLFQHIPELFFHLLGYALLYCVTL